MSRRIIRRELSAAPADLPTDLPDILRRVYTARAVASGADLDYTLDKLIPPQQLGGLQAAAALLAQVISDRQRILIVGDFDADGATSCALCLHALRAMGANDVDYLVPNRFEYGYGLTPEIVAVACRRQPALIMTVDNGISSLAGVAAASQAGIRVVITDHHLPGAVLPEADAIVNPNLPGDSFPSKSLAGVGVAFYVMLALRAHLRESGWFAQQQLAEPNLAQWLDLVALGTVADVVPLDRNNRILVQQGLARIRAGQCVPGIRALLEAGGRNPARTVAADLGFAVGPRLNAAGRLDDMSLGIECLLAGDMTRARAMAAQLDVLNSDRKEIESDMQAQALVAIGHLELQENSLPTGLCLFDPDWHQGVIGILAARIKERVHRPVIAFARSADGEIKGSARSIPGLHIRDALDAVASRHPELIRKFGGHAMAAGLTLAERDFAAFADAFDAEVSRHIGADDLDCVLYSDGMLEVGDLSLATAQVLRDAGPWGQGFPEPLFDGEFAILEQRVVGEHHLKLMVQAGGGTACIDAIAFNTGPVPADCRHAHLAFRLDVNEFRGRLSPQLRVEYLEPVRDSGRSAPTVVSSRA
ncbi:MAG TPA: single-stranded-DNA-specific exonuclease RecJ [Gammaproteobacteria bacterium]|nr:single-stranded-DNA-specific exonuclease RecJ [Gammaproteobacteria bacterium]